VLRYDTSGKLVKQSTYDGSLLISEDTFMFNGKKQLVRIFSYSHGPKTWHNDEFEYDSSGNQVMHYQYNQDTTNLTIERKKYNDKNQLTELRVKYNENDFYSYKKFYYNPEGYLQKTDAYDQKGELIYSYLYEYNDNGKLVAEYLQNDEGTEQKAAYTYNDLNQLAKLKTFGRPNIVFGITTGVAFNSEEAYSYNPDGTLFQWTNNAGQTKTVNRHYYQYY
jgi:hypothetical protein